MTLKEALQITCLGKASKMPCYTYSISNKSCKRGAKLRKIPNSVCSKCYASRGNFCRPKVQFFLHLRENAMYHHLWKNAMVTLIKEKELSGYFRWFPSGDIQSLKNLLDICWVAKHTPRHKHWLPTHEVGILGDFIRAGFKFPPNLIVRLSADMIDEKLSLLLLKRLGVCGGEVSKTNYTCPAPKQDNKCLTCRKCWNKRVKIVTYKYH